MSTAIALTDDEIKATAPSVFAVKPWSGVSERYAFIPTIDVINALRDTGFSPVSAAQSRCRVAGKKPFTKHMLRFQHRDDLKGGKRAAPEMDVARGYHGEHFFYKKGSQPELVELVLTNSHDRSSAYCLDAGMFRLICSNGLIISSANFGSIHIYHSGDVVEEVLKATRDLSARTPAIREQVQRWRAVALTEKHKQTLAQAALICRYGVDQFNNVLGPLTPGALLVARRPEDALNDLWTVTNCIQENMMRGGLEGRSALGRRTRTRPITSINAELDINRRIWACAEVMADQLAS